MDARRISKIVTFGKRPLGVSELLRSRADVIATRVAQDVVQCFFLGDVSPRLPDYNRKFCLVIARAVLTKFGHADFLRIGSA